MLGDKRVMTAIPVKGVHRARGFYEGVLGLTFVGAPRADGSLEYECGAGTGLFTYPTEDNAGKSPATLAAWKVDDIEATAMQVRSKDVVLEDYDRPGLTTEDGIATLPGGGRSGSGTRTGTSSTSSSAAETAHAGRHAVHARRAPMMPASAGLRL